MSYISDPVQLGPFKKWFAFAGLGGVGNAGIVGISATDLLPMLQTIWPAAEIVPGYATFACVFALVAAVALGLFQVQFFVELLQTASFCAILYAFYAFQPAVYKLEWGSLLFWLTTGGLLIGYAASQREFASLVFRQGDTIDKIGLSLVLGGSFLLFLAPPIALSL